MLGMGCERLSRRGLKPEVFRLPALVAGLGVSELLCNRFKSLDRRTASCASRDELVE
jgi:hypothetical protein